MGLLGKSLILFLHHCLPNNYIAVKFTVMKFYRVDNKPYLKLRSLATLIDYGIFGVLFYVYIRSSGAEQDDGSFQITGFPVLAIPAYWFLYFVVLEAVNQATPGHDICKLKVFTPEGYKPSFSDAFKRRICDPIDILFYGIPAFILISKTEKHQRLGDILANTVVAKTSDLYEISATS